MFKGLTPPADNAVGEQDFRDALRLFASGVTIISTVGENGDSHGMTATAFSSLSLRPPLVLVAIAQEARCHDLITESKRFGVSILYDRQTALSHHFSGRQGSGLKPRFEFLDDVPVLEDAMVTLACTLEEPVEGGDHSIFVGLVTAARMRSGEPLLHFGGRYRTLAPDSP